MTVITRTQGCKYPNIQETEQKASQIVDTYLAEDPHSSGAIEFLCLAEGWRSKIL